MGGIMGSLKKVLFASALLALGTSSAWAEPKEKPVDASMKIAAPSSSSGKKVLGSKEFGYKESGVHQKEFGKRGKYDPNPTGENDPQFTGAKGLGAGKWHEAAGTGDTPAQLGKNCKGEYHDFGYKYDGAQIGVQKVDLGLKTDKNGQTRRKNGQFASAEEKANNGRSIACGAAVEGAILSGSVGCEGFAVGNEEQGVKLEGSAKAGLGGSLGCTCDANLSSAGVGCSAFIGLSAGLDGKIAPTLCGISLGLAGGVEGSAGIGGVAQAGYVKGKGWGFKLKGALGLGAGASLYFDPDFKKLFTNPKEVLACLWGKTKEVGEALAKVDEVPATEGAKGGGTATFIHR